MYISQDYTQLGGTESLETSSPDLQVCVLSSSSNWSTASLLLVKKNIDQIGPLVCQLCLLTHKTFPKNLKDVLSSSSMS